MTTRYLQTMFSPQVKAVQEAIGSRKAYAPHDAVPSAPDRLGEAEAAFIGASDSFYMATVGASGWPYIQHRGGPAGFVQVLDPGTLAFADFRGNRQYITLGNIQTDDRTALFFMDYPQRARLKLIGRLQAGPAPETSDLPPALASRTERSLTFRVEAFDWNCSQYITPRHTAAMLAPAIEKLHARIAELESQLAAKG